MHSATDRAVGLQLQLGTDLCEPLRLDRGFTTARRMHLGATAWLEHVPGWLANSEQLFDLLLESAGWEHRDRWMINRRVIEPRLTAQYPDVRDAPEQLQQTAQALSEHYGINYDGLWINQYRDHHDSTSWHRDGPSCRRTHCTVPVLSLGAARRFLIKPNRGGRSTVITPISGDLVVMGGTAQRDFVHCVPKQSGSIGTRISVNFTSTEQARDER